MPEVVATYRGDKYTAEQLVKQLDRAQKAALNEREARQQNLKAAAQGTVSLLHTQLDLAQLLPPDELLLGKARAALHALHEQIAERLQALRECEVHRDDLQDELKVEREMRQRILHYVYCRNALVHPPRPISFSDSAEVMRRTLSAVLVLSELEDFGLIRKTTSGDYVRASLPSLNPSQTDIDGVSHQEQLND